jgi:hypothetical protein
MERLGALTTEDFLGITSQEIQDIEDSAYYESLFDEFSVTISEVATKGLDFAAADDELIRKALGIFDRASEHYSEDSARLLSVIDQMSMQLELLGCSHDHFTEQVQERLDQKRDGQTTDDKITNRSIGRRLATSRIGHPTKSKSRHESSQKSKTVSVNIYDLIVRYFRNKTK